MQKYNLARTSYSRRAPQRYIHSHRFFIFFLLFAPPFFFFLPYHYYYYYWEYTILFEFALFSTIISWDIMALVTRAGGFYRRNEKAVHFFFFFLLFFFLCLCLYLFGRMICSWCFLFRFFVSPYAYRVLFCVVLGFCFSSALLSPPPPPPQMLSRPCL
ncbi:hypothetical protein V8C35DRAFT_309008, partial [Trichoderma chlorosporum]